MFSKALASLLPFLFLALSVVAQVPGTFHPKLALLHSPHADGDLSEAHIQQALWYAAAELRISPDKLPRILVVHGGRDIGAVAGIPLWNWDAVQKNSGATLTETLENGEKLYYLFMLGKPSDSLLAQGLLQILKTDQKLAGMDLTASTRRVLAHMASVVSADELRKGMFGKRDDGIVP